MYCRSFFYFALQIGFFCGMAPECAFFESAEALEIAKRNVEKYFSVVGVLEQMDKSLLVLEKFVPAFFKNAHKEYYAMREKEKGQVNKNIFKPKVPEEVKNYVKTKMSKEFEFYKFCQQRLYKQFLTIQYKSWFEKKQTEELLALKIPKNWPSLYIVFWMSPGSGWG